MPLRDQLPLETLVLNDARITEELFQIRLHGLSRGSVGRAKLDKQNAGHYQVASRK